jgi:thioester reductase-like protein
VKHYFITGGTGVVGSALVALLLQDPDAEIWLLIRASDEPALAARVDALFRFWSLGDGEADARRRIHALRGDATSHRFGLQTAEYEALLLCITNVVHAAGAVRMNLPIEEARRSAVGSAQQVIDFARALQQAGRLQKVEFVSTVGVGGRTRIVHEDWIDAPREFHNTYEQSKAEAEQLMREQAARGLPLTVHRPSMVVGDSRSGRIMHFQVFYHLCEFLSGRRTRGLYPPLHHQTLDIVPADYVARVIAWSAARADMAGRVLHECVGSEAALPLTALREHVRMRLRHRGQRLQPVVTLPANLFTRLLSVVGRFLDEGSRRAISTLPVFLDYLASNQQFENGRTLAALASSDARFTAPDWRDYLDRVLDVYLDSRRRQQP